MRLLFLILLTLLSGTRSFAQADSSSIKLPRTATVLKNLAIPAVLITYGAICTNNNGFPSSVSVKQFRDRNFGSFKNYADDYLVYSNAALIYGFDLLQVPAKNDAVNQTIIMAKTSLLALGLAGAIKHAVAQPRPDQSNKLSFPSGHTALAFALAGVLHHEFKDASPWISVLGYAGATATGAMRILNNKHWYSDVLAGAGIGMLSTNLVYLTHRNKYSNASLKRFVCLPIIGTNYYGLSWQKSF